MSGPDPAVARIRSAVQEVCAPLPPGALVLVACSGGADSLALAAATAFTVREHGPLALRAGAVVIDHGLLDESAAVAERAAAQCRDLGLDPVLVRRVQVAGAGGPEAAAREVRYAALTAAAQQEGAAVVLLGHTRDDQAENVLLGLARGSGSRSLSGMAAERGIWRRPLLDLPRADTEAACAAQGITPWHDPTNTPAVGDTSAPLRSRVRTRVLPVLERELGPGIAAALARTASGLREDADALDLIAAELAGRAMHVCAEALPEGDRTPLLAPADPFLAPACDPSAGGEPSAVLVDIALLRDVPAALRRRVLRMAAVRAGVRAASLTRTHLLAVDQLVTDWHGQGPAHLPGQVVVTRACGRLALRASTPVPAATDELQPPAAPDPRTSKENDSGERAGYGR